MQKALLALLGFSPSLSFQSSFSMCRMAESDGCAGLTVPDAGTLAAGMGDTASAGHMLPRISCWQGVISSGWGAPDWGEGGFTVGRDAPKLNIEGGGFGHQAVHVVVYQIVLPKGKPQCTGTLLTPTYTATFL